jgi:hypothetical protein
MAKKSTRDTTFVILYIKTFHQIKDETRSVLCHQNYQSAAAITYTRVRFETMNLVFSCTSSYKVAAYRSVTTPYKTDDNWFHLFEYTSNQNKDMQFQHQLHISYTQN